MSTESIQGLGLLANLALIPTIIHKITEVLNKIASLELSPGTGTNVDGWLSSREAACYLGMSENTFEKFCRETTPRIKRHKVGGKYYYKKTDLDNFMRLYEMKSKGLM